MFVFQKLAKETSYLSSSNKRDANRCFEKQGGKVSQSSTSEKMLTKLNGRKISKTPRSLRFRHYASPFESKKTKLTFKTFLGENRKNKREIIMDFTSLMQQAQKLVNETQNNDDLPRVERSMPQILKATKDLHSRVTSSSAQDIQA